MRIGQLARRIGIPPSDVLNFLGTQNIETEAGANSRLSDDMTIKIINHFAPEKLADILHTPTPEEPVVEETPIAVVAEEPTPEPVVEETPEIPPAPTEVIRVAKVELQGLKVVGKIDLPEKKKIEPTTEQEPAEEQEQPQPQQEQRRQPRRESPRRNDRRDREWLNPLEAERQREAREAEKRRKDDAERQKEKRTNHYYNKVKSVPTKAVRRFEETTVVEEVEVKEPPKGLFGRFLNWLRN